MSEGYTIKKHDGRQREDGWGNCPKCGWFYKQDKLDHCPMCRHAWRIPVSYQQPVYESPQL